MALPQAKAMDLAKDMAKKGISGSIAMKAPGPAPDDEGEDGAVESIKADLAKACPGCDADKLYSLIDEICRRADDEGDEDEEGPESAPMLGGGGDSGEAA